MGQGRDRNAGGGPRADFQWIRLQDTDAHCSDRFVGIERRQGGLTRNRLEPPNREYSMAAKGP